MRMLWVSLFLGCAAKDADTADGSASTATPNPLDWSVHEPGPFSTGFQSWDVTYRPLEDGAERTVQLNLWYPTDDDSGPAAEYSVGIDAESIANALPSAPAHEGGFPVHAYSHGYRGYGEASAFMSRYLASHGWVTVAPNHTNNTIMDHEDPLPSAHYYQRPLDVRAVLDALEALPEDHPLAGQLRTDKVVLSGHSFGAYTTWAALGAAYDLTNVAEMCATGEGIHDDGCTPEEEAVFATDLSDDRIAASLPMAGTLRRTWFGEQGEASVNGPVLFMGGTNDDVGQAAQFDGMGAIDFTWMEIDGGCHQTFALGSCGTLSREEGFGIVQTVALAWARHTILADQSVPTMSVLTGEHSFTDLVTTQATSSE